MNPNASGLEVSIWPIILSNMKLTPFLFLCNCHEIKYDSNRFSIKWMRVALNKHCLNASISFPSRYTQSQMSCYLNRSFRFGKKHFCISFLFVYFMNHTQLWFCFDYTLLHGGVLVDTEIWVWFKIRHIFVSRIHKVMMDSTSKQHIFMYGIWWKIEIWYSDCRRN